MSQCAKHEKVFCTCQHDVNSLCCLRLVGTVQVESSVFCHFRRQWKKDDQWQADVRNAAQRENAPKTDVY